MEEVEARYVVAGDLIYIHSAEGNVLGECRVLSVSPSLVGESVALRVLEAPVGVSRPYIKIMNQRALVKVMNPRDLRPESTNRLREILDAY